MPEMTTARLTTTGLHCQSCSMLVKMNVEDLPGVTRVESDFRTGMTEVEFDRDQVGVDDIIAAIVAAGYGAEAVE